MIQEGLQDRIDDPGVRSEVLSLWLRKDEWEDIDKWEVMGRSTTKEYRKRNLLLGQERLRGWFSGEGDIGGRAEDGVGMGVISSLFPPSPKRLVKWAGQGEAPSLREWIGSMVRIDSASWI